MILKDFLKDSKYYNAAMSEREECHEPIMHLRDRRTDLNDLTLYSCGHKNPQNVKCYF